MHRVSPRSWPRYRVSEFVDWQAPVSPDRQIRPPPRVLVVRGKPMTHESCFSSRLLRRSAPRSDNHLRCHCEPTGPACGRPEDKPRKAILSVAGPASGVSFASLARSPGSPLTHPARRREAASSSDISTGPPGYSRRHNDRRMPSPFAITDNGSGLTGGELRCSSASC